MSRCSAGTAAGRALGRIEPTVPPSSARSSRKPPRSRLSARCAEPCGKRGARARNSMAALRYLLAALSLATAMPRAWADDYPAGLIREQLEQASRRLEVDLGHLKAGELQTVEYVGRPVHIYRRTKGDRDYVVKRSHPEVVDPSGANLLASVQAAYASSASQVWARLLLVDQA